MKEEFKLSKDTKYVWLYTIIFLPNIVVPFFVGVIIDKTGLNNSMMAVILVQSIGQLIFSIGGLYSNFSVILVGRAIYGLGSGSITWV